MPISAVAVPCIATALVLLQAVSAAAQTTAARTIIPVHYSSDPMTRNADIALSGGVLATSAIEEAIKAAWLRKLSPAGGVSRTVRIATLVAFDVPVLVFAAGLNHEGGHIARSTEKGYAHSFEVVGSPWSGSPFQLYALDERILNDLGSQSGGFEGSRRLKDRSEAFMWRAERLRAGHALTSIIASLDLPLYAWHTLSPAQFAPGNAPRGDPAEILRILTTAGEPGQIVGLEPARGRMRARALLNLVDYGLWTLTYGVLVDHLWNGEDGVEVRWLRIAGVDVIPSLRYEWGPLGTEYYIRSHYRTARIAGLGYVRWSEALDDERQVGVGASILLRQPPITPRLDLDLWSHTADGAGVHGVLAAEIPTGAFRAAISLAAGAKSAGYVHSLPLGPGPYVTAGLVFRIW